MTKIKIKKKTRTLYIVLGIILIIVIGITYLWHSIHTFSTDKWASCKNVNMRMFMVEDLNEKYNIIGMSNEEIRDLLGTPTKQFNTPQDTYRDFEDEGADQY